MTRHAPFMSSILLLLRVYLATLVHADRVRDVVQSPPGWKRTTRAHADTVVHLQIGLKSDGFRYLEQRLYEISSPSHSAYGRHLSGSEVAQLLQPSATTVRKVEDWLLQHDITGYNITPAKDWIRVAVPLRTVESLLHTEYHHYVSQSDGDVLVRTLEWSVPAHLRNHIDVMQPTNSFLRAVPQDRYGGIPKPDWEVQGTRAVVRGAC